MPKNPAEELELELQRSIYRESYYEFFKDAFKVSNPTDNYSDNWHIEFLCNRLQKEVYRIKNKQPRQKDIIINIPFRSAKSLICTVVFPVWAWTIFPEMKFICTSYSGTLALEHAELSRNLLESQWFQKYFSDVVKMKRGANAKSHFSTEQGGFRKSVGMGAAITGSGGDVIICLDKDQLISTDRGDIKISDIVDHKMDVNVLSFNHHTQKSEYKPIKRYDKNSGRRLIKITSESGKELICTEEHEVWTENRGYVMAKDLTTNDILKNV